MNYIYKITNLINNKIYIGKTSGDIYKRFNEHKLEAARYIKTKHLGYKSILYPAMAKYGIQNFKIEEIHVCSVNESINDLEKYYIAFYDSCNPSFGYNISQGGLGGPLFKGHHHSAETKAMISAKGKGIKQDPEFAKRRCVKHKKPVQNLNTGIVYSSSRYVKYLLGISIANAVKHSGKCNGEFWIQLDESHKETGYNEAERLSFIKERIEALHVKYSAGRKKAYEKQSEETRAQVRIKQSETMRITIANRTIEKQAEIAANISASHIGKKHSQATIEKLKDYYKKASEKDLAIRKVHNSLGQKGKKRYENPITKKHKMFYVNQQPEGWVLVEYHPKNNIGKKKFKNKISGACKMFYPDAADLIEWEQVVTNEG